MKTIGQAMAARLPHGKALTIVALIALAGCTSREEKARRYEARADQQFAANDYFGAADSLYHAVDFDSNDPNRWIKLARAERLRSNNAQSAIAYQRALDLQPDNVEGLQALAILNVRSGQFDVAKRHVDTLLTLAPDDVGGWIAKGAVALYEQRLKDADAAADRLIQLGPGLSEGPILKARVLEAQGNPAAAVRILRQRLELDADNPDVAMQALSLYQRLGDRAGIQATSLVLARLIPDDPRYQLEAARTYRARGLPDEAERTLAALAERFPRNVQVQNAIAWDIRATRPNDAAVTRIAELAAKAGSTARASLARMLVEMGAPDQALALTTIPAANVEAATVDLRSAHAAALLGLGRIDPALAEANAVLQFDAADTSAMLTRARIYRLQKKYADALIDAQTVFSNEKTNADAALLIARIYVESGSDLLAGRAFGAAQDAFPLDFRIHSERIAWLMRRGEREEAAPLALSFARRAGTAPAWQLADQTCRAAADALCTGETRTHLRRA